MGMSAALFLLLEHDTCPGSNVPPIPTMKWTTYLSWDLLNPLSGKDRNVHMLLAFGALHVFYLFALYI